MLSRIICYMNYNFVVLLSLVLSMMENVIDAKTVHIKDNIPIQQQFNLGAVTYSISSSIDLNGTTIRIPDGATLKFKKGSLFNGTITGSFRVKGVKKESFRVRVRSDGRILNTMPVYNHSPEVNASVMSSCASLILLKESIETNQSISLSCSLDGNGHCIKANEKVASVLVIKDIRHGITIKDLIISRDYSGTINTNYAILCYNSSNISLINSTIEGRLQFVNNTSSDDIEKISSGVVFSDCILTCDLSCCPQGWEYGQDHLAFYSIKNIQIENCKIKSTNVNRIIKTSEYFANENYETVSHCSDDIVFQNNEVVGRCTFGKQMWDMFCGTTNVTIKNNSFNLEGFTRFIENKASQNKYEGKNLVSSIIRILNNRVITSGSDLFQFRTNPRCDSFEIRDNSFIMKGNNKNTNTGSMRSCGGYLQGYKSAVIENNVFSWQDEAVGLLFLVVNFNCDHTIIRNNTVIDASRIEVASTKNPDTKKETYTTGKSFYYVGNKKEYSAAYNKSREELYIADMIIDSLHIDVAKNVFNNSYEVIFARNTKIKDVSYRSKASSSKSFYRHTNSVQWGHFNGN